MRQIRMALAGSMLLLSQVAYAQKADEAHRLASAFLTQIHANEMMGQMLTGSRLDVVAALRRSGFAEEQSGKVFDSYMAPGFRARLPELRSRMEDILVADFTVPELHAIVDNAQNEARRSAAAKTGQLQPQFAKAGQEWMAKVGADVFSKNKEALEKLRSGPGGAAK